MAAAARIARAAIAQGSARRHAGACGAATAMIDDARRFDLGRAADQLIQHAPGLADVAQPILRIAREAIAHEPAQARRRVGGQRLPVDVACKHRGQRVRDVLRLVAATSRQHLVQHDAEGPDIRAAINGPALRLLGRHVGGRAHDDAHLRRAGCERGRVHHVRRAAQVFGRERLRQAKIQHLHRAIVANLDVRGLEIAMDDAALVRELERLGDLARDREHLIRPKAIGRRHRCGRCQGLRPCSRAWCLMPELDA